MKRHELMDLIQEIQDRNYNKFVGTNEAELATREEICDLLEEEFKKVNLAHVISWVAIADRYPEVGKLVLCARTETSMNGTRRINSSTAILNKSGKFTCALDWIDVDYWAELPEPPCL